MTLRYPSHKISSMERYVAESSTSAAAGATISLTDRTLVRLAFSGNGTISLENGSEDGQYRILMVETVTGSTRLETGGNVALRDRAWLPQLQGEVLGLMWNATDSIWYEMYRSIVYDSIVGIYVKNITGSSIPRGSVVYIDGATGNNPHITLADYTTEVDSARTIGLVRETILNNNFGYVINNGLVTDVNTNGMTSGQSVYLGASGAFTNVKPVAPNHMVKVGNVIRVSSTVGSIQVWVSNGFELNELHDVLISAPANNDVLTYETSSSLWKNKPVSGGGGSGTVTTVSVVSANGLAGTVANPTTTPAITLSTTANGMLQGNGTAISAATIGASLGYSAGTLSRAALTGDVTAAADANATTIAANAVTNTKLADVPTATFKGRITAGTGDPEDLTGTQATTLLNNFTSTLKGLAPASGGGTSNFLRADGTWAAVAGSGTVTTVSVVSANGLAGTVANPTTTPAITLSTSVTGLLKGNGTAISAAVAGTDYLAPGPDYVTSSTVPSVDNALVRYDGTTGKIVQSGAGITLSDTGEFSRAGNIAITTTGAGTNLDCTADNNITLIATSFNTVSDNASLTTLTAGMSLNAAGSILVDAGSTITLDATTNMSLVANGTILVDAGSDLTLDSGTDIKLQNAATTKFIVDGTALQGVEIGLPGTRRAPYIRSAETAVSQLASPLYSFVTDQNTGMTSSDDNTLSLITDAASRVTIDTTAITATLPHRGINGTVTAPAYSFSGITGSGMWANTKSLNFSSDTEHILALDQNALGNQIRSIADGTANRPAYSFQASTSTGMRSPSANNLCLTSNGTDALHINASQQVGIGTATPDSKLEIAGTKPYIIMTETIAASVTTPAAGKGAYWADSASNSPFFINDAGHNFNLIDTGGSSVMYMQGFSTANLTSTKTLTSNTTYALYLGKSPEYMPVGRTINARYRVTTIAATVTWAEVAIATGNVVAGGPSLLTNRGFTNIAAVVTALGVKNTSITTTSVILPGQDIWLLFGVQATTPGVYRAASIADDLQSGVQLGSAATRPSTMGADKSFSAEGATVLPMWMTLTH